MTRISATPPKLRGKLLLSASLLTTSLVAYGRPAQADCSPVITNDKSSYLCSGTIGHGQYLRNDTGNRDITVNVDETADFNSGGWANLHVSGSDISITVDEGATFDGRLSADGRFLGTSGGSAGDDLIFDGDIDIIFNGEIDQTEAVGASYQSGISVTAKYGDTRIVTGSGDITLYSANGPHFTAGIDVRSYGGASGNVDVQTGSGSISGGKDGIRITSSNDAVVTTGDGDVAGNKYGIHINTKNNATVTTGSGDVSSASGNAINIYSEYGNDVSVTTGSGDVSGGSGNAINIYSEYGNDVTVTTGSGDVSGGRTAIDISSYYGNNVTVTTNDGAISGGRGGISVDHYNDRYGDSELEARRNIAINTGAGAVSGDKYGIQVLSNNADIQITTGAGAVGVSNPDENSPNGPTFGIFAFTEGFSSSNSSENVGDVDITIGEGGVKGEVGVFARGKNTSVTVVGDVVVAEEGYAGILVGSKYAGTSGVPGPSVEVSRLNEITIESGASVNAANGYYGITSKYGNSDITIAGEVIGGSESAITTNKYNERDSFVGTTRIELQSGFAITGDVIAEGPSKNDVLALGGAGDLSFDLSKIEIDAAEPETEEPEVPGLILAPAPDDIVVETEKQYYGFDQFEKVGSGTATLGGMNDAIDNFAVREGTLQFSDAMAEAMAVDLIGGQVTGAGRIGNLIARTGTTVAPGVSNEIATIAVAGDLSFETGSTFAVNVNGQGESDLLDVDGTAAIGSDVALAITGEAGDYSVEDLSWTVIAAKGGVTGTFGEVTDNLVDVQFADLYDGDTVVLQATVDVPTPIEPPVEPVTPPTTASGVSDKSNGPASTVGAGFAGLSFAAQLNGVPQQGNVAQSTSAKSLIGDNAGYFSSKGDARFGMTDMTVFFGTFTERSDIDASDTTFGYETSSTGLLGGLSYANTLTNNVSYQVNLALGISGTNTQTDEGSAESTDYHFGLGGVMTSGPLDFKGALGYSMADIELDRLVGDATATAQTDARTLSGVIQASYDMAAQAGLSESARLAPMLRIRGYSTTSDAYQETGAGILNLNVGEVSSDALYAGVGFEFSDNFVVNGTTLRPTLNMVYDTKISGDDTSSASTITGVTGEFDTIVNGGPDNLFSIDAGVAFDIEENVEGFVNYGTTLGEDLQSHRGTVGMTIKF